MEDECQGCMLRESLQFRKEEEEYLQEEEDEEEELIQQPIKKARKVKFTRLQRPSQPMQQLWQSLK